MGAWLDSDLLVENCPLVLGMSCMFVYMYILLTITVRLFPCFMYHLICS